MADTQRKTIAVFSTAHLPYQGGAEIAVDHIARQLSEFDFIIFTSRFSRRIPRQEQQGNITILRFGIGSSIDKYVLPLFAFARGYAMFRRKRNGLLLWGVMISQGSIAAYFLKRCWPNVPFLLTLQEGDSETHIHHGRLGLIRLFWRLLLSKADCVQSISRYLADMATSYGFRGRVHVVPNGVDWKLFSEPQSKERIRELQKHLGISQGTFILITVSRLVEKNGLDNMLHALPNISDAIFIIIGEGVLRESLQKQCAALHITDRVLFLGDIPHHQIPLYLQSAHLFIRPSRSEGLGNAFLEAMAAGLPVIATPVGGIRDFLVPGKTGLAVTVDNPKEIAAAVAELRANNTLYAELKENGKKLVKEKYEWKMIGQNMKNIFIELQQRADK